MQSIKEQWSPKVTNDKPTKVVCTLPLLIDCSDCSSYNKATCHAFDVRSYNMFPSIIYMNHTRRERRLFWGSRPTRAIKSSVRTRARKDETVHCPTTLPHPPPVHTCCAWNFVFNIHFTIGKVIQKAVFSHAQTPTATSWALAYHKLANKALHTWSHVLEMKILLVKVRLSIRFKLMLMLS